MRVAACLILCVACHGGPGPADGPDLSQPAPDQSMTPADQSTSDGAADELAPACRADKMTFTQATGCQNDGSVEFCLPAGDPALLDRAKAIAPALNCAPGGGRAGCKGPGELLCSFPTGMAECVARHGALTDAAWERLCQLAALPEVKRIVPTWFE